MDYEERPATGQRTVHSWSVHKEWPEATNRERPRAQPVASVVGNSYTIPARGWSIAEHQPYRAVPSGSISLSSYSRRRCRGSGDCAGVDVRTAHVGPGAKAGSNGSTAGPGRPVSTSRGRRSHRDPATDHSFNARPQRWKGRNVAEVASPPASLTHMPAGGGQCNGVSPRCRQRH